VTLLEPVLTIEAGDAADTAAAAKEIDDAKTFSLDPTKIRPFLACPVPEGDLHRICASETQSEASHREFPI